MFEHAFQVREYEDSVPFRAAGFEVTARRVLHYDMLAFGFRVSHDGITLAYSGDSGPSSALPELARDADLFLCEATLAAPNPEGGTRGHLSAREAQDAFDASGAKRLLLTHRPVERPLEEGYEQAYDWLELDLAPVSSSA
jgi:ribonuclease BN (tRNA processing enzyme)